MKKILLLLSLVTITFGVSGQTLVSYNKADEADFNSYKTYKINKLQVDSYEEFEPKREGLSLLIFEIEKQMNARGYTNTSGDDADLLINIGVLIRKVERKRETTVNDAPQYIGQRNYHWESEVVTYNTYPEGTITFDLVDVAKNELIWQAVSKGALEQKREKNKKKIERAVKKLFKKFPKK